MEEDNRADLTEAQHQKQLKEILNASMDERAHTMNAKELAKAVATLANPND